MRWTAAKYMLRHLSVGCPSARASTSNRLRLPWDPRQVQPMLLRVNATAEHLPKIRRAQTRRDERVHGEVEEADGEGPSVRRKALQTYRIQLATT
mmetsp:Transcript_114805/g.331801  ORF Transcript_114805/g.331801 Transcript_114805/m.331801 type:complete len:95 (+) Transcript_114805:234-518(+)